MTKCSLFTKNSKTKLYVNGKNTKRHVFAQKLMQKAQRAQRRRRTKHYNQTSLTKILTKYSKYLKIIFALISDMWIIEYQKYQACITQMSSKASI